ncbi:hypothetical protein NUBL21973_37850 [Klebsiella pneumoniae]|nr:hypothetical protein NUBL21973_37850 [Klebsiella pneumoniae]
MVEKDPQYAAAKLCTDEIQDISKAQEAKGIRCKHSFKTIPRTTLAHDGTVVSTEVLSIPYVTSTYVDNGVEGSAWRKCVEQKMRKNANI